ncbi:MAG TPA: hypothetical protein VL325_05165, partial [Pyrinomonadaceae bacterium]|nr:hypothetical protein [Pyrinomonadaceae bacterium]
MKTWLPIRRIDFCPRCSQVLENPHRFGIFLAFWRHRSSNVSNLYMGGDKHSKFVGSKKYGYDEKEYRGKIDRVDKEDLSGKAQVFGGKGENSECEKGFDEIFG